MCGNKTLTVFDMNDFDFTGWDHSWPLAHTHTFFLYTKASWERSNGIFGLLQLLNAWYCDLCSFNFFFVSVWSSCTSDCEANDRLQGYTIYL